MTVRTKIGYSSLQLAMFAAINRLVLPRDSSPIPPGGFEKPPPPSSAATALHPRIAAEKPDGDCRCRSRETSWNPWGLKQFSNKQGVRRTPWQ